MQTDTTDAGGRSGATVAATVMDSAFRGQGYDHVLALPDGTALVGVFSEHRWTRSSCVQISLEPDGCLLFPGALIAAPDSTESTARTESTATLEPAPIISPLGLAAAPAAAAAGPRPEAIRS